MIFYRILPSTTSINIDFQSTNSVNEHSQVKSICLSDIGGLKKEKSDLIDLIASSDMNCIQTRGILLHGPKGCGKTMLIHAIAHEISATLNGLRLYKTPPLVWRDDLALFNVGYAALANHPSQVILSNGRLFLCMSTLELVALWTPPQQPPILPKPRNVS